jgi:hypothetical protein
VLGVTVCVGASLWALVGSFWAAQTLK